jgi:hypothetical protein
MLLFSFKKRYEFQFTKISKTYDTDPYSTINSKLVMRTTLNLSNSILTLLEKKGK